MSPSPVYHELHTYHPAGVKVRRYNADHVDLNRLHRLAVAMTKPTRAVQVSWRGSARGHVLRSREVFSLGAWLSNHAFTLAQARRDRTYATSIVSAACDHLVSLDAPAIAPEGEDEETGSLRADLAQSEAELQAAIATVRTETLMVKLGRTAILTRARETTCQ